MRVQSLGWEDPLEEEMATHASILAWRISQQRSLADCSPWGHKESDTTEHTRTVYMCELQNLGQGELNTTYY